LGTLNVYSRPAVWFPTVRTNTGTDVFTERLVAGLRAQGLRAEVHWLPLRAEYAPWTVTAPKAPAWANVCHVNTWLHARFLPEELPVVATVHHSVHDPGFRPYKSRKQAIYHRCWIAPNERRVIRQSDAVVAVSHFVADMSHKVLAGASYKVIHNSIDTKIFCPDESRLQSRRKPFRLLYAGNWIRRKGVDLLAPIMRRLGEGFELYYTGGEAAARDKPEMPNNMIDLGRLNGDLAVAKAMRDSDAFLFPSRSEGFGLVAAEAMACGLPVVAMNSSALPEVVKHNETGFLCNRDDVRDFVEKIKLLANDKALYEQMCTTARSFVLEHFSFEKMLSSYTELYYSLNADAGRNSNLRDLRLNRR